MEFKVKEVSPLEEKSVQEVEKNLLDKHEEKLNDEQPKAKKYHLLMSYFLKEK